MTVIDVDSHFFEPFDWLDKTDPELAAEIPEVDELTLVLTTAFGEVLAALPPQNRPNPGDAKPQPQGGAPTAGEKKEQETKETTANKSAKREIVRIRRSVAAGRRAVWRRTSR